MKRQEKHQRTITLLLQVMYLFQNVISTNK